MTPLIIIIVAFAFMFFIGKSFRVGSEELKKVEPAKPQLSPLTDAQREVIRQAEEVFDWNTRQAVVNRKYTGPLPEQNFGMWDNLYPNIYHTKIAGINYAKKIKDLAGQYFDCYVIADPTNKYDHNAIKIVHTDGRHLGFIPADETEYVREFLDDQLPHYTCRAYIGEDEEYNDRTERYRTYLYGYINICQNPDKYIVSPQL